MLVGKYVELMDAYLSVTKALQHACLAANRKLELKILESGDLEPAGADTPHDAAAHDAAWATLRAAHGVLVPGGFGGRGTEGKIAAAKYARESGVPYFGICLGMQTAVIEFARNVLGLEGANSTEWDPATPHPVVVFMPEISTTHKGGTMRLGSRRTILETTDCVAAKLYQVEQFIDERYRHRCERACGFGVRGGGPVAAGGSAVRANRASPGETIPLPVPSLDHTPAWPPPRACRYEINPEYVQQLEEAGLRFVGRDEMGTRMGILELRDHPYYVAAQVRCAAPRRCVGRRGGVRASAGWACVASGRSSVLEGGTGNASQVGCPGSMLKPPASAAAVPPGVQVAAAQGLALLPGSDPGGCRCDID